MILANIGGSPPASEFVGVSIGPASCRTRHETVSRKAELSRVPTVVNSRIPTLVMTKMNRMAIQNRYLNILGEFTGETGDLSTVVCPFFDRSSLSGSESGASGRCFDFVIANNEASSLPHYNSSRKIISEGILLFDVGCKYEYYCSDFTRTIFLGKPKSSKNPDKTEKLKQIYDIVLQAQTRALKACRAGISCKELDHISRKYIEEKGYGKFFGHGLGHGVGLEIHELPTVSYIADTILKEDMVITIEPGIYLEGIGGVRIEDIVVVRDGGCENFYSDSKSLTVLE